MGTVYYCWTCQAQIAPLCMVTDTHYETGEVLRFCSGTCRDEYLWLKAL